MANYYLFLDDERTPAGANKYMKNDIYVTEQWVIVRSYDQFVKYITDNGMPAVVSFDHDLSYEHYEEYDKAVETGVFDYDAVTEKTGMDCVKWLVNYCMDSGQEFPIWYLHTRNEVGFENMRLYILSFLRSKQTN